MNKKQRKTLFIIGLILIIIGISNQQKLTKDKKLGLDDLLLPAAGGTTSFVSNTVKYSGIGLVLMGLFKGGGAALGPILSAHPVGWTIGIVAALVLFLAPGLITRWMNAFRPQPTIPMWVWIVGFFILFMFIMQRKK